MAFSQDFKLNYIIDADGKRAKAELTDIDRHLNKIGSGVAGLGAGAATMASFAAGLTAVAAAGSVAVRTLFDLTKQAAEYGSAIFDASEKTGLHAETLSAMDFAAKQSGTSLDQLTGGIAKFSKTVGAASEGSKEAAANLTSLGIDPQEALNDLDGSLAKVFERINDARPGVEQITLAQKAFGKSGADLLPFIKSFDGDLAALTKRAKELGVTIDDEAARSADEFGDQLDTLSAQFSGLGRTIGTAFMPVFMDMAKSTSDWAVQNKKQITDWATSASNAFRKIKIELQQLALLFEGVAKGPMLTTEEYNEMMRKVQSLQIQRDFIGTSREAQGGLLQGGEVVYPGGTLANKQAPVFVPRGADASRVVSGGSTRAGRVSSGDNRSDKQVYQDFVSALKGLGVPIGSGYRTYKEQAALYARLPRGQAAAPGTSDHEFYRAVDVPPSVSQAILEKAARTAGVILEKELIHQGTGLHRHQPFRKGRMAGGGGESDLKAFSPYGQGLDLSRFLGIEDPGLGGDLSHVETYLGLLKETSDALFDLNEHTREESFLRKVILGEYPDLNEWQVKSIADRLKNIDALEKENKELEEQRKIQKELNELQKANPRPINMKKRMPDPFKGAKDWLKDLPMEMVGQFADGVGSLVENFVLMGDVGPDALKKMTASILGNVASQAATLAIMELAYGIAALTPWGAAIYGPAPPHFQSAALFGSVAAGAALAGRAIAGDSFKKDQGGRGSGASSSGGRSSSADANMTPIQRYNDDTFNSGHRNPLVEIVRRSMESTEALNRKISSMKAGDVLVAGANQKKGFIGSQAVRDFSSNASSGTRLRRVTGSR